MSQFKKFEYVTVISEAGGISQAAEKLDISQPTLSKYIKKLEVELGIELFVLDDGWFGERNNDHSSLGDWFVNEGKLKGGLGVLIDRVNALGMKFGIW